MNKYGAFLFLVLFAGDLNTAAAQNTPDMQFPQIAGFKLTPGEKVYTSDNLFEIIDGAADVFLTYGFEELRTAEYSAPGIEYIRVETYRHSSRANAFGMYAPSRITSGRFRASSDQLNDADPYPSNIVNAPNIGQLLAAKGTLLARVSGNTDLS